jgi:hypothetical protein
MILDKDKIVVTTIFIGDPNNIGMVKSGLSRCYDNKACIITCENTDGYYVYENGAIISPDKQNPQINFDMLISFDNPFDAYNYFQEVLDNENDQQQQQQQQDQQRKDARIPFIRINANGDGKLYTCDGNFENIQDENENVQVSNFDINALTQKDISMQVQGQDLIGILIKYEALDLSQDEKAFFFLPTDAGSNQNQQQCGNPPPQGGNPPPQGGNPPPQGGNPPPQGGNPPPQGGNVTSNADGGQKDFKVETNSDLLNKISELSGTNVNKLYSYFERNLNMAELFLQNTNFVEIQKELNTNETPRELARRINQAIKDNIITIDE